VCTGSGRFSEQAARGRVEELRAAGARASERPRRPPRVRRRASFQARGRGRLLVLCASLLLLRAAVPVLLYCCWCTQAFAGN